MLKKEIEDWLDGYDIKNYTIHDNMTVDVNGDVDFSHKYLIEIPVQFRIVTGNFNCYDNPLPSLEGCAQEVGGHFCCDFNKLTSLEWSPKEVGLNFICYKNPLENFDNLNFEVANEIIFNPTQDMAYLDEFKDNKGNINIDFKLLKITLKAHKLDKSLTDELHRTDIVKSPKFKV